MLRLSDIDALNRQGKFQDTWDSLRQYQVPDWYQGLKFGIFIHWGVFSVPAYRNEWYPRNMYIQGTPEFEHHVATYGAHKAFGYKDFIPMFTAERFNPETWAELFSRAGAQYVIPVGEHHDGFQMYASELSPWNAVQMGPKRDVLGELSAAIQARGLVFGTSSHRMEHWFYLSHGRDFDSDFELPMPRESLYWPSEHDPADLMDPKGEPAPSQEFLEDWLLRTCELIDRCHPAILYFDWWIQHVAAAPYVRKMAAYYYNRAREWGTGAVINYKYSAFPDGMAVPDVERGHFADQKSYLWQGDTSTALNSWCHTAQNEYREPVDLLSDMIDVVSKNGRFLLNIGPMADGTIAPEDEQILTQMGDWLKVNGEAIYPTRPWKRFGEGPTVLPEGHFTESKAKAWTHEDFRFTQNGSFLYAIAMKPSPDGQYSVTSLGLDAGLCPAIQSVTALTGDQLEWHQASDALRIKAPAQGDWPVVFRCRISISLTEPQC